MSFLLSSQSMATKTRIKICGITRIEDALISEQLGVDALGFVFCEASKRFITPRNAKVIIEEVAPFITRVGLFLNASESEVEQALKLLPGIVPQFHGTESAQQCEQFGVPYLKAIGLGAGMPSLASLQEYKNAMAFLFDSNVPGQLGGTGHAFDWQTLDKNVGKPVILAGGLAVDNVKDAIAQIKPYAVDVSSGVEASKGIKDIAALKAFVSAVHEADAAS